MIMKNSSKNRLAKNKLPKKELAAILAAISFSAASAAHAASPVDTTNNQNEKLSSLFGVKEHQSPMRLGAEDGCGEGMCSTSEKGKEGSCKGKDGSCKGKDGSCKGKDGSCKGKEGSCKGKEGSCKSKSL